MVTRTLCTVFRFKVRTSRVIRIRGNRWVVLRASSAVHSHWSHAQSISVTFIVRGLLRVLGKELFNRCVAAATLAAARCRFPLSSRLARTRVPRVRCERGVVQAPKHTFASALTTP